MARRFRPIAGDWPTHGWSCCASGLVLVVYAFLRPEAVVAAPVYKRRLAGTFSPVRSQSTRHRRPEQVSPTAAICDTHHSVALVAPIEAILNCWCVLPPTTPDVVEGTVKAWQFVFSDDYVAERMSAGEDRRSRLHSAIELRRRHVAGSDGDLRGGRVARIRTDQPRHAHILVAILNARLGVWLPNPRYVTSCATTGCGRPPKDHVAVDPREAGDVPAEEVLGSRSRRPLSSTSPMAARSTTSVCSSCCQGVAD